MVTVITMVCVLSMLPDSCLYAMCADEVVFIGEDGRHELLAVRSEVRLQLLAAPTCSLAIAPRSTFLLRCLLRRGLLDNKASGHSYLH